MKIDVSEHDGCFGIDLQAETLTEAALLTRIGMNATKDIRSLSTFVTGGGEFQTSVVLGKAKRANNEVPRRN